MDVMDWPEDTWPEGSSHNPNIRKQVGIRHGLIPGVCQWARVRVPGGEVAGGHEHGDMEEVFWVAGGAGWLTVGGTCLELMPGRVVRVEPGEWHELRAAGDGLEVWVLGVQRQGSVPVRADPDDRGGP